MSPGTLYSGFTPVILSGLIYTVASFISTFTLLITVAQAISVEPSELSIVFLPYTETSPRPGCISNPSKITSNGTVAVFPSAVFISWLTLLTLFLK